jgi:hypothetical protein
MKELMKFFSTLVLVSFFVASNPAHGEEITVPTGTTPSTNVTGGPVVYWNPLGLNKKPSIVSQSFVMKSDWVNNLHIRGTICWTEDLVCNFDVAFSIGTYWKSQPNLKNPMVRFDFNNAVEVKGNCSIAKPDLQGNANKVKASCINYLPWVKGQALTFVLADNTSLGGDWWDAYINITTPDFKQTTKFPMGSVRLDGMSYKALGVNNNGWIYDASSCSQLPQATFQIQEPKSSAGLPLLRNIQINGLCNNIETLNVSNLAVDYRFGGKNSVVTPTPTPTPTSDSNITKPTIRKPEFSLINVVGNKLNIDVNIGSAGSSRPDTVYLVAPKLGVLDSNRLFGKVSGSKASWSIDFDKLLSGTSIPLKVVGVKNGVESDPLETAFDAPSAVEKLLVNKSVPAAPRNVKSRIVGTSALISAEATVKTGSLATEAFVFGPSIGLSKSKAISGDIVGNKVLPEVPLKSSMAGKKLPVTIYLSNEIGDSQPVQTIISIPAAPKIPSGELNIPSQTKVPKTIFCVKGSQTRTFAAKSCPPGWKSA